MAVLTQLPTAFLDSNVIIFMLQGKKPSITLFDDEVRKKVRLAINPIVYQEIFALDEVRRNPTLFEHLQTGLTVLPVDFARSSEILARNRDFRNQLAHSNDVLILGSAITCDYFVTYDQEFFRLPIPENLKVVTPEQLLENLGMRS